MSDEFKEGDMKLETRHAVLLLGFLAVWMLVISACAPGEPTPTPTPGPGTGRMPDEPFGITFASHHRLTVNITFLTA